jgi:hypothetical protein
MGTKRESRLEQLQALRLLEESEAERYARRSRWSLFRAVRNGHLRRAAGGRRPLYEREALDQWILAGRPTGETRGRNSN